MVKALPTHLLFISKSVENAKTLNKFDEKTFKDSLTGLITGLCITAQQNFPKATMILQMACKVFPQVLDQLR